MEGLLILIGIWVLDIVIKKVAANRKKQQEMQQYRPSDDGTDDEDESQEEAQEPQMQPPRSLQDLIRQFENAQNEAEQGNIEPPTPPVERPRHRGPLTLRVVAETVIEVDVVDAEFLMDEFGVDENVAADMLADLQAHRIIGRDMGEGEYDVLVHDLDELENLFNREKHAEQETSSEVEDLHRQELERQRELNALEERAKSARENAAASTGMEAENSGDDGTTPKPRRAPLVSTRNLADVRKGFIWAKVLDEPRFKRRWSTQYR